MKNAPSVNLLRGRGRTFFDRFVDWALTFGRLVVIVTEAIALSAFLYRFVLDREIVDLHDNIQNKQALVKRLANNETTYRNLQQRLAIIKQLNDQAKNATDAFRGVFSTISPDVILDSFSMDKQQITMSVTMNSISSLSTLVDNLRTNPLIDTISLDSIANKTETATLDVGLTLTLKNSLNDYGTEQISQTP